MRKRYIFLWAESAPGTRLVCGACAEFQARSPLQPGALCRAERGPPCGVVWGLEAERRTESGTACKISL